MLVDYDERMNTMKKTLKGLLATTMLVGGMSFGAWAVDVQEAWFNAAPNLKKFVKGMKANKDFTAYDDQELKDLKAEMETWGDHDGATFDQALKDLLNQPANENMKDDLDGFIVGFGNQIQANGTVLPDARDDATFGLAGLKTIVDRMNLVDGGNPPPKTLAALFAELNFGPGDHDLSAAKKQLIAQKFGIVAGPAAPLTAQQKVQAVVDAANDLDNDMKGMLRAIPGVNQPGHAPVLNAQQKVQAVVDAANDLDNDMKGMLRAIPGVNQPGHAPVLNAQQKVQAVVALDDADLTEDLKNGLKQKLGVVGGQEPPKPAAAKAGRKLPENLSEAEAIKYIQASKEKPGIINIMKANFHTDFNHSFNDAVKAATPLNDEDLENLKILKENEAKVKGKTAYAKLVARAKAGNQQLKAALKEAVKTSVSAGVIKQLGGDTKIDKDFE